MGIIVIIKYISGKVPIIIILLILILFLLGLPVIVLNLKPYIPKIDFLIKLEIQQSIKFRIDKTGIHQQLGKPPDVVDENAELM